VSLDRRCALAIQAKPLALSCLKNRNFIMGTSARVDGRAPIHNFYSSSAWIEGNAVRQLEGVAALSGVTCVAAMPDLHAGKYGPVGCTILSDHIHPQLVGADVGCGMGLYAFDLPLRKLSLDKAVERMRALDNPWDGDASQAIEAAGLRPSPFDAALGTVGGGNHFCELQAIDTIAEPESAARAGLDRSRVYALVHSGSRGLGYAILEAYLAGGVRALPPDSAEAHIYVSAHDAAVRWASLNRCTIAQRAGQAVRADIRGVTDVSHNFAEATVDGILHRKGTAPSDRGLVPIPGSRGTLSYLVEPIEKCAPEALASLAHGAGRKFDRGSMHGRVRAKKSDLVALKRNPFGGVVVCEDKNLLIEESPDAYKAIDRVIGDLKAFGLARVVATFRPLLTFKTATRRVGEREKTEREDRR
jgi:release factor H-coupled RctB family protein